LRVTVFFTSSSEPALSDLAYSFISNPSPAQH